MSGLCDIACKMDFSFKSELLLVRAIFVRTNGSSGNSPTKKTHTHQWCVQYFKPALKFRK